MHCLPQQAQYGLLVSYGFALLYTAFSFPAGYACDRFPRTRLLLGAALAWAAATMAQGMASCFAHVLIARVLLGIAQSFSGPAAHTLISDTFPASRRATANSIYSSGIYLGAALASLSAVLANITAREYRNVLPSEGYDFSPSARCRRMCRNYVQPLQNKLNLIDLVKRLPTGSWSR